MEGKTSAPVVVRFRGAPDDMEGIIQMPFQQAVAGPLSLELKLPLMEGPVALQAEAAGASATWLRFALPEVTPPGTYQGSVRVGSESYESIADVAPLHNLVLTPDQLSLDVQPGTRRVVELTLANLGNVGEEIPKAHGFGLFDVEGVERGIRAGFSSAAGKGQERINRLAEELAESHGGLVRILVQEGAGRLEPGEWRTLRLELHMPQRLKPRRSYSGTWRLANLSYLVEVRVDAEAPLEEAVR